MGVLGKSRQGCVGVINNIGALTNLLTSKAILECLVEVCQTMNSFSSLKLFI